jgi:hypothetical protein
LQGVVERLEKTESDVQGLLDSLREMAPLAIRFSFIQWR